jgi:hypothetical protein
MRIAQDRTPSRVPGTSRSAAAGSPVRVHGQEGYPVKGPGIVAFPRLDLLVVLEAPDRAVGRRILSSLRRVGPIIAPGRSPRATAVKAIGGTGPGAGWAPTAGGLFDASTGGRRWTGITPAALRPGRVSGVFFLSRRHGWVAAGVPPRPARGIAPDAVIYRTADGGARWRAGRPSSSRQRDLLLLLGVRGRVSASWARCQPDSDPARWPGSSHAAPVRGAARSASQPGFSHAPICRCLATVSRAYTGASWATKPTRASWAGHLPGAGLAP